MLKLIQNFLVVNFTMQLKQTNKPFLKKVMSSEKYNRINKV
jgi:hypothetical protein